MAVTTVDLLETSGVMGCGQYLLGPKPAVLAVAR
jgi:hypothetical protein